MIVASATRALQDKLESGRFDGPLSRLVSRAYGGIATQYLVRKIEVPHHLRVIAVGGSTLGGSGKTPVAIAWAREEAKNGGRVALIGHAYRARPKVARVVSLHDDVHAVGDEALLCARALGGVAEVIVAPTRQLAVDFAVARGAAVLVLDGVAQISPRRADVALLVTSSEHANACPPAGDLRSPFPALEALANFVVRISDEHLDLGENEIGMRVTSNGARAANGDVITYDALSNMRVGLGLSIAHPERVLRMLERRGVVPVACVYVGDHAGSEIRGGMERISRRDRSLDAWLISEKCASFVVPTSHDTVPIYVVAHELKLELELHGSVP
ncbi:MAG: tetraacyldisaccharide 4'-kinase [Polyangiaceae bacterium]